MKLSDLQQLEKTSMYLVFPVGAPTDTPIPPPNTHTHTLPQALLTSPALLCHNPTFDLDQGRCRYITERADLITAINGLNLSSHLRCQ